jgi:tRNA modification GTPase
VVVAPATPHGRSALAVVRLTGRGTLAVLDRVARPARAGRWHPGRIRRVVLADREGAFDDGLGVWFAGPRSYTGEDLAELSVHGNPEIVARLVAACVDAGARVAGPGEFTRRAVLHGRMDLVRAEAVDQLVRAASLEGVRVARDGLDGRLGAAFAEIREPLVQVAAELEARLDWPGDELALEPDPVVLRRLEQVADRCGALAETHRAGRIRVEGARVALVGPVNAGKSSLFNRLVGAPRAIVHESPGTTRDVVEARVRLGSLEVVLLDTAGDRVTADPVEALGVELARRAVAEADLVVVVARCRPAGLDEAERGVLERTRDRARIVVTNGVDEPGQVAPGSLPVSARTGEGVDRLVEAVTTALAAAPSDGLMVASERQRDRLLAIGRAARGAIAAWDEAGIAVAADLLTEVIAEIDALTGADTREEILDAVFARFCIGK